MGTEVHYYIVEKKNCTIVRKGYLGGEETRQLALDMLGKAHHKSPGFMTWDNLEVTDAMMLSSQSEDPDKDEPVIIDELNEEYPPKTHSWCVVIEY